MKSAAGSSASGLENEARSIAEEAARRAGLSVRDWVDAVVAERAAQKGAGASGEVRPAPGSKPPFGDFREPANAAAAEDRVSARPLVEALHGQIAALTSRLDRIRALNDEQRLPPPADAEALKAGLASMTRSIADLAPRNAAIALSGAVSDLNQRLDAARKAGASDALTAPVETMLREILATLRTHDPNAAIEKLERELRVLSEKVDALASAATSPSTLERIRKQTEEIRDLLALAARTPFPFERLEKQLGDLADRVERLASAVSPPVESERVVEMLAQVRAQIERATPKTLLGAIERRLDRLTARVDEALEVPEKPARRTDAAPPAIDTREPQAEEAAPPSPPPQVSRVEAALAEIRSKLDHPPPAPDMTVLTTTLRDLAARLDKTIRQPPPAAAGAALPFEDLGLRIDRLRAVVERQAATGSDPHKLDTALAEIRAKLDRESRSADEIKLLAGALGDLKARLDADGKRAVDKDLMQRALDQIGVKLDAIAGARVDLRPIERAISALSDRLDARDTSQPDLRLVEEVADRLAERLSPGAGLERALDEMQRQLEGMRLELQSSASQRSADSDLQREILDLRAEQRNADRRTSERLSEVQGALEKLLDFLSRESEEAAAEPDLSPPSPADASEHRLRNIPDRVPSDLTPALAARRSFDAASVLLEPGATAPKPVRDIAAEPPEPAGRSQLNVHIAAARRAAQAALVESASKKLQRDSIPANSNGSAPGESRSFLRGRRRPVLLALALVATAATGLAVAWRGDLPQAFRRLLVSPPVRSASSVSPAREPEAKAKPAAAIDYSPVGNVAPPGPKTAAHPPGDLVAAIPAGLAQSLRDRAASGDPAAETELALAYLDGRTIAKDPAAAARWLELAAVQGLPVAQYRLAALYEKGNGVPRDAALAHVWYLKAANAGNARAMHNLAVLIAEDPRDGKPDYAEAAHWFRKAAEFGIRDSQFNLGVLYGRGLGVPQDLGQSWMWFSLAARQGDADAAGKRDEVAAKMDASALAAASKALEAFKTQTPSPEANDPPSPAGAQGRTNEPAPAPAAHGAPAVSG